MSLFNTLFPVKKEQLTKDDTALYFECFCHNFGRGGYVLCCEECKNSKPTCAERREHNKKLQCKNTS